jgi:hypothetical protein
MSNLWCLGDNNRMIGVAASVPSGGTAELRFKFPGRFCPRQMYIISPGGFDDLSITSLKVGNEEYVISGNIGAAIFAAVENGCCPCFTTKCVCRPGVDIVMTLFNSSAGALIVNAVLFGEYLDLCA